MRAAFSSLSEGAPAPKSDAARFWPLAMWAVTCAKAMSAVGLSRKVAGVKQLRGYVDVMYCDVMRFDGCDVMMVMRCAVKC